MMRPNCKWLVGKLCVQPRCDACFDIPAPEYCVRCRFFTKENEGERHTEDNESPQEGGRVDRL